MMEEFILSIIVFLFINWLTWMVVDRMGLVPSFLDYQPFNCRKCATFWTLVCVAIGAALGGFWTMAATLGTLAALNAVAMHIHQKKNTINYDEYIRGNNKED